MERKLASIQLITDLQPIVGADRIELASVLGWKCVVDKGQFTVGSKCIYFEIDALIPMAPWNDRFRKDAPDKPLRIRSRKFRSTLSQGLCFDLSILPVGDYAAGQDVSELLGVTKYEPYVPPGLQGKVKGTRPSWIPKTDEVRLQSEPGVLPELLALDIEVVGTMKMDGTSFTAFLKDDQFGVCSRNMELLETENNAYWKAIRKTDLEQKMRNYFPWHAVGGGIAVQGELCGPGIQGNKMGLTEPTLYLYNGWDIAGQSYMPHTWLLDFTLGTDLNMVQVVFQGKLPVDTTIDSLLKMADDLKYPNGTPAEGIVWRPVVEQYSQVLKGRMSFKTVSNVFLMTYKQE
jgi:RNA ligase (TIGR02306 family)